jgi:transcription elongation factor Elf1
MATVTNMDKIIDNLPQSPEAARIRIVRDRLLGLNMKCKGCGMVYKTETDMEFLRINKYSGMTDPDSMTAFLECGSHGRLQAGGNSKGYCGHEGTHTFRPNPFILSRRGAF